MKHQRRKILTSSIVTLSILLCIELAARWYVARYWPAPGPNPRYAPAPAMVEYWTPEFGAEFDQMAKGWQLNNDGYATRSDFAGKYFTVVNNERVVLGRHASAPVTVWVFGSSTVFDFAVPDKYTFTTMLQAKLGQSYSVRNLGVMGGTLYQSYTKLQNTPIHRGDIVLFYNGGLEALDVYNAVYRARTSNPLGSLCDWFLSKNGGVGLATIGCDWIFNFQPSEIEVSLKEIPYSRVVDQARTYAQQRGTTFYNVLEPAFYKHPIANDERGYCARGMERVAPVARDRWRTEADIDLTSLLINDPRAFTDCYHVAVRGNAVISSALYKAIAARVVGF
jgi:hypothetical protein